MKRPRPGEQVGGPESQEITRAGWMVLGRLMESIDLAPTFLHWAGWVGEGSTSSDDCQHLSIERVASTPPPPALSLKLVNFDTPCMSLGLFELLPLPSTLDLVNL